MLVRTMRRKRKSGSLPPPILPSFAVVARAKAPLALVTSTAAPAVKNVLIKSKRGTDSNSTGSTRSSGASSARVKKKRRKLHAGEAGEVARTKTTESSPPLNSAPRRNCASASLLRFPRAPSSSPLLADDVSHSAAGAKGMATELDASSTFLSTPQTTAVVVRTNTAAVGHKEQHQPVQGRNHAASLVPEYCSAAEKKTPPPFSASGGMTPSEVVAQLLDLGGWRLESCLGSDCSCTAFQSPLTHTTRALKPGTRAAAGASKGSVCLCGHRSVAHELVDARTKEASKSNWISSPPYRYYQSVRGERVGGGGGGGATVEGVAVTLRRLFAAIRNARAVGDCGLFEDSEGMRGWGVGWFLSRYEDGRFSQANTFARRLRSRVTCFGHWALIHPRHSGSPKKTSPKMLYALRVVLYQVKTRIRISQSSSRSAFPINLYFPKPGQTNVMSAPQDHIPCHAPRLWKVARTPH